MVMKEKEKENIKQMTEKRNGESRRDVFSFFRS